MGCDLDFIIKGKTNSSKVTCTHNDSNHRVEGGIADFEFAEIGSIEWIRQVHIPYMRLHKDQRQGTVDSLNASILDQMTSRYTDQASFLTKRIIKDLVLTSLVNEKCGSVCRDDLSEVRDGFQMQTQCIKFHESLLCSLLEPCVAESNVVADLGHASCELFLYCYRKALNLVRPPSDEYPLKIALGTLPIARHLILSRTSGSLSLTSCIFDDCEYLLLLIELVERAPWYKNDFKFNGQDWSTSPEEICLPEGNVWLSIWSLLLSEEVHTGRYDITISHRMGSILSLRRYMTTALLDQIPVLSNLQRFLEELNLSHHMGHTSKSSLMISVLGEGENHYEMYKNVPFNLKVVSSNDELREICTLWTEAYELNCL